MNAGQFDLTVHDLQLSDTTRFGLGGKVEMGKRLTFYVGEHGPFVKVYTLEEANTARLKSDVDAQVMQLRDLANHQTAG